MARDRRDPPGDAGPLKNNPFASLRDKLGAAAPENAPPKEPEKMSAPPAKPGPARAVLRIERKGRGGKEVTILEKLELDLRTLESWLSELKRALGTGGMIEGDNLVFQGDHRKRLATLLEARGVRRVTIG